MVIDSILCRASLAFSIVLLIACHSSVDQNEAKLKKITIIDLNSIPAISFPEHDIHRENVSSEELKETLESMRLEESKIDKEELKIFKEIIKRETRRLNKDYLNDVYSHEIFKLEKGFANAFFIYHDNRTKKVGVVDTMGNVIVSPIYSSINQLKNGYNVRYDKKHGILNNDGEIVVVPQYRILVGSIWDSILVAKSKSKAGIILDDGEILVPISLDYLSIIKYSGMYIGKMGGKYGAIDTLGGIAVPFKFDKLEDFKNGLALATVGEHEFYINRKGECITNCQIPE